MTVALGWIDVQSAPAGVPVIGTLGPEGTSSEQAARLLRTRLPDEPSIVLRPTYEQALADLTAGTVGHVVVANAYPDIHHFYMAEEVALASVFVMDTPLYGIARRPDGGALPDRPSVVTHPSPRPLVAQLLPTPYRSPEVATADSTSQAALAVAQRRYDLALTTELAAARHGLRFISRLRPIRMVWSVFVRTESGPGAGE
jgi:prephenate dehydratase